MKKLNREECFIVSLDYGNRKLEREFVRIVLNRFNSDTLVGTVLFINNNPYALELLLFLNFEKDGDVFEEWLRSKYPEKRLMYNLFIEDLIEAMRRRGYNIVGLTDDSNLGWQMSSKANDLYFFPDRKVMYKIFGDTRPFGNAKIFLSHSSKDKSIVDVFFRNMQKAGIRAWYDKYEIRIGDSITDKINEGLESSTIGLIFMSKNFINSKSGWPINEANYFFQRRMREKYPKIIIINIDLDHNEIPPLMQDYKYLRHDDPNAIAEIVKAIK